MQKGVDYEKKDIRMLIVGYVLAVAGGLLGVVWGMMLAIVQVKDAQCRRFYKYDKATRKQGWIILVLGILSLAVWNNVLHSLKFV